MKEAKKAISLLHRYYDRYDQVRLGLEDMLKPYCDFESGVEHLQGDGHMMINIGTSMVAPLYSCIEVIARNGKITEEEHKELSL